MRFTSPQGRQHCAIDLGDCGFETGFDNAVELKALARRDPQRAVRVAIRDRIERQILIGGQPPPRNAGADHELPELAIAALLAFSRAIPIVALVDPVEFEERIAFLVERRGRVGEVAGDMTAQLTALQLDRLGF